MSFARKRLLIDIVKDAGLEVVGTDIKNGRVVVEAKAPNGVSRSFSLSTSGRSDPRGDLNENSRIKRFAKANTPAAPEQLEETPEMAQTAASTPAAEQLTPIEFYKLCERVKTADLAKYADIEVAAQAASTYSEKTISVGTLREAMDATGIVEPEAWTKLPEPHVIFARELESMLSALGQEPSPLFRRYLSTIA